MDNYEIRLWLNYQIEQVAFKANDADDVAVVVVNDDDGTNKEKKSSHQ